MRPSDPEPSASRPIDVGFSPPLHPLLPVELVTRSEIRERASATELSLRQRTDFHQLILCNHGHGVHHVDFEPIEMRAGRLLHVHPGQVQQYQFEPDFGAHIVLYRAGLDRAFIPGYTWFPGSDVATLWDLPDDDFAVVRASMKELRREQQGFDGSPTDVVLMESLLTTLVARIHRQAGDTARSTRLPETYVRYREFIEEHFRERPTVAWCARELGYSTRTLDRTCQAVLGRTAKNVLDDRIALDIKRLLTHSDMTISRIGATFGFTDPSSFSKFVYRHLGMSPSSFRAEAGPSTTLR